MTSLVVCPGCTIHVREDEARCPHCGATLSAPGGLRVASKVALLMGLGVGLAGCPVESKYGVPATASPSAPPVEAPEAEPPEADAPEADADADADAEPAADAPGSPPG